MSESQRSLALMLLALGLVVLLPLVVDLRRTWHRVLMLGGVIALALRYIWWRGTETLAPVGFDFDFVASSTLFALELVALVSSLNAAVLLMRRRDRHDEATKNAGWWGTDPAPKVALMIATYNEEREVLERTIVGALSVDWPNAEVMVLDDGKRDWLATFCAQHGVRHITRPDNAHAKAGNINHALDLLDAEGNAPDFVAILDADFVPHRNFLTRCVALFHDESVGLVQTPQHFFNADPIQHNLGLAHSYPDEQRFFFDHIQPARDGWGIAICCGTSSVMRWSALRGIGGFPTDSVTEDYLLSLTLQERGLSTAYLNEPLTEGLAAEGVGEYVTQRARWCLGLMQIARGRLGPLGDNKLRLRDRWSVMDTLIYWLGSFSFRLAGLSFPLLYWFFGTIVVDARVPEVLSYFGVYYVWSLGVMNLLSRGTVVPVLHDVSQIVGAIPITRAALHGLLRPKGHKFKVTAKGGDRSRIVVQWRLMMPYLALAGLSVIGLWLGSAFDELAHYDAGDGKAVVLFWTFYNLFVLSLTILACIELPRHERHVADAPERVIFAAGDAAPRRLWLASLTQDTARIRGRLYPAGTSGILRIPGLGDMEATVIETTADGARLRLAPSPELHHALLRRFYTEGAAPGIGEVKLGQVMRDIARRLSFSGGAS
ncbi:glycosyltransferase [Limimaricola litoreus]|uniref:Glycosyltransferase n=1 Tax=Limimaricola litoreus TaxID=2955316 RepID=A0A9X2JSR3_9RHOB|nr:glycosyltransferase [Limimaricola litoreus]MCP1170011.1 glycosyltransferase [Limimaricola litoreus]